MVEKIGCGVNHRNQRRHTSLQRHASVSYWRYHSNRALRVAADGFEMAHKPPRGCSQLGCGNTATHGRRCVLHQRLRDQRLNAGRVTSTRQRYGSDWPRLRTIVLQRDPVCCRCGSAPSRHVDHLVPWPEGSNDIDNLQGLCHRCHSAKTMRALNARQTKAPSPSGRGPVFLVVPDVLRPPGFASSPAGFARGGKRTSR